MVRTWDVDADVTLAWWNRLGIRKRLVPHNDSSRAMAQSMAREQLRKRVLQQKGGVDAMHWHVFDFDLIVQLLECFAYEIQFVSLWPPFHQVVVARKPEKK